MLSKGTRDALREVKAIADRAVDEGRDFTPAEQAKVDAVYKAVRAEQAVKQSEKDSDEALRQALRDLGIDNGLGGGSAKRGPWASAYFKGQQGTKALITPSGSVGVPSPLSVLAPLGDRVDTVLQLIPTEQTDSDGYAFLRETVRTHNADTVAAEGTKPTSVYSVEKVESQVETIAHLSQPIPRSYLADAPLLAEYLDTVLREGVTLALEEQVIGGSGVSPDLEGILETSGVQTQAYSTDILTTCRKAVTLLELVSIAPTGWVFHPSDWETIELLTSANHYLMGAGQGQALPVDRARRRLWGVPVALSVGMTEGDAILADFRGSTHLWDREQTRVDWSENVYDTVSGKSDFERNLIRYRAEGRWGFAVTRPNGVVIVSLTSS